MAQYGAYGYAQHGWTYDRILAHYYHGTTLGRTGATKIRVLLASGRASVTVSSSSEFTVRDGAGKVVKAPAGAVRLGADLSLAVGNKTVGLTAPVRFVPGHSPLSFGRSYRGWIVVTLSNGKLVVVNRLGIEPYVQGVVAGEMPAGWSSEALKTQAVAARSYALASRRQGGSFDVYDDTHSQVYGGIPAEDPRTNAAVHATKRQIVLFKGKVATAFFSASSGGRTAAIEDAFSDSDPVPYLVSVDDPYDTISPYHNWGPLTFTVADLRQKLGNAVPADLQQLQVKTNPSGRVATVTAVGAAGATAEFTGAELRTKLGLRSTWFTIDEASLMPSAKRILYGGKVRLRGVVHGTRTVRLERRPAGGGWSTLKDVKTGRRGSFSVTAKPRVTTSYRLRIRRAAGQSVRVVVAPRLTLAHAGHRVVRGHVQPGMHRVAITIQRRTAPGWTKVATTLTARDGSFRVRLRSERGTYRARVEGLPGLATGVSRPLRMDGE
jgi:stage II sporulation protein D